MRINNELDLLGQTAWKDISSPNYNFLQVLMNIHVLHICPKIFKAVLKYNSIRNKALLKNKKNNQQKNPQICEYK